MDEADVALANWSVSRETRDRLVCLVDLLRRWQTVKNLVGPKTLDDVWRRHVADSLQLVSCAAGRVRWADMGSGAGFPGLVVAAAVADIPGSHLHLIESNGRKCAFLREAARAMSVPVTVHDGRIEAVIPTLIGQVDVVSARALAPLSDLFTLSKELLISGAWGVFPKGQDVEDELTQAARWWRFTPSLVASQTDPKARIVVIQDLAARP